MNKIKPSRFIQWIVNHPWKSILVGLLLVGALVPGMGKIQANFTHTAFFYDDDHLLERFNAFERQFGNDDAIIVAVHSPSGVFDEDSADLLEELTERMWRVSNIIRVDSLSNYSWVHAIDDDIEVEPLIPEKSERVPGDLKARGAVALSHEVLPGYLVSEDGKTALVFARVRPGFENPPDHPTIAAETRAIAEELQRTDHSFYLSGGVAINDAFKSSAQADLQRLMPFVFLLTIILLVVQFRSIQGVVLPLLVVIFGIMSALAAAGWLGVELSTITMTVPQILIAVGVADSVHILTSYFIARRRGVDRKEATGYTLQKNILPTLLTTASTSMGFIAFATAPIKPVAGLGFIAAAGTVMAWLITYFVMGGLLSLVPWKVKAVKDEKRGESTEFSRAVADWIYRKRIWIVGGAGVFAVGAVWALLQNQVNSDPYKYFDEEYPVRMANDFVTREIGGTPMFEMAINSGKEDGTKDPEFLQKVQAFQEKALALPKSVRAVSIVDIYKQINRSLHGDKQEFYILPKTREEAAQLFLLYTMSLPQGMDVNDRVTVKNDSIRMTLVANLTQSSEWMKRRDLLESMGKEMGLDVEVTGKALLYQGMNDHVVESFIRSIATALVLISLLLIFVFRSVKLGLIALIPNLLPLFVGGLVLFVLGKSVDIGTVLVASVCLGIAVDDTIHILSNFKRLRAQGVVPKAAIAEILTNTGRALLTTTIVLVGAFGTLGFATFIPNQYFGILTATILSSALLIDLLVLPALLYVLDPEAGREERTVETA